MLGWRATSGRPWRTFARDVLPCTPACRRTWTTRRRAPSERAGCGQGRTRRGLPHGPLGFRGRSWSTACGASRGACRRRGHGTSRPGGGTSPGSPSLSGGARTASAPAAASPRPCVRYAGCRLAAVGEHREVGQPEVDPHLPPGRREWLVLDLHHGTTAISTRVHRIRWASTSIGAAGSRSGQNAGKSPHVAYAPTPRTTPRRSRWANGAVTCLSKHPTQAAFRAPPASPRGRSLATAASRSERVVAVHCSCPCAENFHPRVNPPTWSDRARRALL